MPSAFISKLTSAVEQVRLLVDGEDGVDVSDVEPELGEVE